MGDIGSAPEAVRHTRGGILDITHIGSTNLELIRQEHQTIRLLVEAYEKDDFSIEPNDEVIKELKDTLWTMDAADVRLVANELEAEMAALDATISKIESISKKIDDRHQACLTERKQTETEFTSLRKKTNNTNLSRGVWPIYGGVVVGAMAAFLARQFDLGMIPCVIAGAAGYFIGNQLIQQLFNRTGHAAASNKDNTAEQAQLDQLRGRYEELTREYEHLANARDCLHRLVNQSEDLQFAISEALHEAGEEGNDN